MKAGWMMAVCMAALSVAGPARPADEAKAGGAAALKPQATCPVMGGPVSSTTFVDVDGQRIFLCCPGCAGAVKKEPQKYIDKLKADGVQITKVQAKCPVTGEAVDRTKFVDLSGKRIYVCCDACIPKIKADAEAVIKKLESGGVALDPTPKAK